MKNKLILKLASRNIIKMKDEEYIKLKYFYKMKKKLDVDNVKTFNEKLQWLKLYDRNPEYTKMVDKYEVKKYVSNIIGEQYIIPTLGVWDRFEDINFEELPNQFVLKCTHDSGGLVICKDKNNFNINEAKKKINKSLIRNYYYHGREWPYKNVEPRIIAEEYMVDESGTELKDYKIYCFNGEPKIIQVDFNRFKGHKRRMYTIAWKPLKMNLIYSINDTKINKPNKLDEMLNLTRILAKDISFVRIDFYVINDKIYFGEMTFYPESGFGKFQPDEWDEMLGSWLELPKEKLEEKNEK